MDYLLQNSLKYCLLRFEWDGTLIVLREQYNLSSTQSRYLYLISNLLCRK